MQTTSDMKKFIATLKYWVLEGLGIFLTSNKGLRNFSGNGIAKSHPSREHCFAVKAHKGLKCGSTKEYKAFIADYLFHAASFKGNTESFDIFVKRLGLTLLPATFQHGPGADFYNVKENFAEALFWKKSEVPANAHPILGHSNGSLVKCYWKRVGDTIEVYRPNPNAKEVFKPLPLKLHILIGRNNGGF